MSDGVQFTITTVEFQDGPYQGANVGEPIPTPVDPINSTSDPTTEDSGEPIVWGSLVVFLRLGGSGRDALELDAGDVDLRQALADSSTADIATETDLSALDAIEGLYPPEAATTTLRSGTVNFQLVAQAPGGEEVSVDGITWASEATIDATAAAALYQTKGATGDTLSSTPISATGTFQRRQGAAYRASTPSAAGNVPMRMINPVTSYQVLTGTEADAAGLPQALLSSTGTVAGGSQTDGNTVTFSNTLSASAADAVTVAGIGATALDAYNATALAADAWQISFNGSNTIGGGGCAGTVPAESITGSSSAGPVLFSSSIQLFIAAAPQLAGISNTSRIASEINYYDTKMRAVTTWTSDVTGAHSIGPTDVLGHNNPGMLGANPFCNSGGHDSFTLSIPAIAVGSVNGAGTLDFPRLYIGTFLVKADWP